MLCYHLHKLNTFSKMKVRKVEIFKLQTSLARNINLLHECRIPKSVNRDQELFWGTPGVLLEPEQKESVNERLSGVIGTSCFFLRSLKLLTLSNWLYQKLAAVYLSIFLLLPCILSEMHSYTSPAGQKHSCCSAQVRWGR